MNSVHKRTSQLAFRPATVEDSNAITDLFQDICNRSNEWVEWKYHENPWRSVEPFQVAVADERVVGVVGFLPLALQANNQTLMAVRVGDIAITPAYAASGVAQRLRNTGISRFASDGFALAVDIASGPHNRDQEQWQPVSRIDARYRFHQCPGDESGRLAATCTRLCKTYTMGLTQIGNTVERVKRIVGPQTTDIARQDGVAIDTLRQLRECNSELQADRTRDFLKWRYNDPNAVYTTYVAYQNGAAIAAILTERISNISIVTEVLGTREQTTPLLATITADQSDASMLIAPSNIPTGPLERLGFMHHQQQPFARHISPQTMVVAPLDPRAYRPVVASYITDTANWNCWVAEVGASAVLDSVNGATASEA